MRDAGHVKHGIVVGQRIKSRVVAERPLMAQRLGRIDIAFDDNIRVSRNFDIHGYTVKQFDAFLAQKSGKENLIDLVGQWRCSGIDDRRIAAEANRELESPDFSFCC